MNKKIQELVNAITCDDFLVDTYWYGTKKYIAGLNDDAIMRHKGQWMLMLNEDGEEKVYMIFAIKVYTNIGGTNMNGASRVYAYGSCVFDYKAAPKDWNRKDDPETWETCIDWCTKNAKEIDLEKANISLPDSLDHIIKSLTEYHFDRWDNTYEKIDSRVKQCIDKCTLMGIRENGELMYNGYFLTR